MPPPTPRSARQSANSAIRRSLSSASQSEQPGWLPRLAGDQRGAQADACPRWFPAIRSSRLGGALSSGAGPNGLPDSAPPPWSWSMLARPGHHQVLGAWVPGLVVLDDLSLVIALRSPWCPGSSDPAGYRRHLRGETPRGTCPGGRRRSWRSLRVTHTLRSSSNGRFASHRAGPCRKESTPRHVRVEHARALVAVYSASR